MIYNIYLNVSDFVLSEIARRSRIERPPLVSIRTYYVVICNTHDISITAPPPQAYHRIFYCRDCIISSTAAAKTIICSEVCLYYIIIKSSWPTNLRRCRRTHSKPWPAVVQKWIKTTETIIIVLIIMIIIIIISSLIGLCVLWVREKTYTHTCVYLCI